METHSLELRFFQLGRWILARWKLGLVVSAVVILGLIASIWHTSRNAAQLFDFSEAFYATSQSGGGEEAQWAALQQQFSSFKGAQWISVQRILALTEDKQWAVLESEALALAEDSDSPELKALAWFVAASSAENNGESERAEKTLDRIVSGSATVYIPLAQLEKGRLLAMQGKTEQGKKLIEETLRRLDEGTDSKLIDWAQTILLWVEANDASTRS